MERERDIEDAYELLDLDPGADARQVHAAYRAALERCRAAGKRAQALAVRAAYARLRRLAGTGGGSGDTRGRPMSSAREPAPTGSRRRRKTRSEQPAPEEVLGLVDRGRLEAAALRVCEADWHKALEERGMWEDTLIRLACATRWLAPSSYKLLHDHHGSILARPALGHLARAYVAIAETTTAWTAWHEFRSPDDRLVAMFTRGLCGSWPARRRLIEAIGGWIAEDRRGFLVQLEGLATLDDRLLDLLELICAQVADDLLLDLPNPVDPERHAERLQAAFPPSVKAVGVGLLASAAILRGGRGILPGLLGGGLLAGGAEKLASFMLTHRRRELVLDLCLETGVTPHGLALWAAKQGAMSRARPWAGGIGRDRVLALAFALERVVCALAPDDANQH